MVTDNDESGLPDLSNRKILAVLMQEIADVHKELSQEMANIHRELKEDIAHLDKKLTDRTDALASDIQILKVDVKKLRSDFGVLRLEVHQNQITFMKNHQDVEQRVAVLEAA